MTTETALTLPQRAALALESSKTELRLRELVASTADMTEVLNKAARDQIHSAAMTYRDHRVTIGKVGKTSRDDAVKFGKAVIEEENRLTAIIEPEEKRLLALRDAYDAKIEAEKQAKLMAERARIDAIQARIKRFSDIVLQSAGRNSEAIKGLQERLSEIEITEVDFEEFIPQATEAKSTSASALEVAYEAAYAAEQAIEAARIKREEEDRQRAAEAAENARVKADLERQAAELARAQKEADNRIKAQAAAETARIQAEANAHAAEHAKAMDELNRQRAEFEAQQQEVERVKALEEQNRQDAAKLEADHAEALYMNSEYAKLDTLIDDAVSHYASTVNSSAVADALIAESLNIPDTEPTDEEIIDVYIEAFGGTPEQAIERLQQFASALVA